MIRLKVKEIAQQKKIGMSKLSRTTSSIIGRYPQ
jgi:hypothetical protein